MATNPRKNRQKKNAARKAQKRSLTQHIKSLPPELDAMIEEQANELVAEAQGQTQQISPASLSPASVNVTVKVDQQQVAEEKKAKDAEIKIDKDLLKALKRLSDQFDPTKKEKKGLAGFFQTKINNIKNAFTLEGAAGMMGIRRDDGSLKGAILGSILQRSDAKKEKAKFISNFGMFTDEGRKLSGDQQKLAEEGSRRYERLTNLRNQKDVLEQKAAAARAFGGSLSESDQRRLRALSEREKRLSGLAPMKGEVKAKPISKEEALITGGAEGIKESLQAATPEERAALAKMDPEVLKNVFRGALEELVNISDDQLKMLEKLAKGMPTEEDRLEAKKAEGLQPITTRQEEKIKEEANSSSNITDLFGDIKDLFKKGGKGKGRMGRFGKRVLPKMARFATNPFTVVAAGGAMASLAATSVVSSEAGKPLREAVLGNSMLGAMSGDTAMASGIIDANDGLSAAEVRKNQATEQEMLKDAPWWTRIYGIGKDDYLEKKGFIKKGDPHVQFGSGQSYASVTATPEKTEVPTRVAQSTELAVAREELSRMENVDRVKEAAPTVVNNAPTNIVNNKTTNIQRIPVRNTEPTFNSRLRTHFA